MSGVVLFARNSKAADRLAVQFRERTVTKIYWAIVEGALVGEGEWTDWLRKVPDQARAEIVEAGAIGAKEAVLRFRVLTLLEGDEASDASALHPSPKGREEKSLVKLRHHGTHASDSRAGRIAGIRFWDADYGRRKLRQFGCTACPQFDVLASVRYEPH